MDPAIHPQRLARSLRRHPAAATFVAGFLFDLLTMQRIDAWLDLAFQLAYLLGLTVLLLVEGSPRWRTGSPAQPPFRYHLEVLHFFYGGLLSAYVVLYFRSSTLARPALFLALLVAVMFINEVPRVRNAGYRMRLGLYAFCVLSFLTYFIPILIGRIGGWIFLSSLLSTAAIVWVISGFLLRLAGSPAGGHSEGATTDYRPPTTNRSARLRLCAPAGAVLIAITVLYVLRLIPPVPLSVQFQGIYHEVRRDGGGYTLTYQEPPAWAFWRRDSRPFERRAGDRVHYFARVFAPSGFEHQIVVRWEQYIEGSGWVTTDRIRLDIVGGRADGFRGVAVKSNFEPGRWRVTAETGDGRAIATLSFDVENDASGDDERRWRTQAA